VSTLWDDVPVALRQDDAAAQGILAALLRVIGDDVDAQERSLWELYDDQFIETCADWVVPYIGALVANDLLYDTSRNSDARRATELFADLAPHDLRAPLAARARADVARTIYYRRRKGTPAMVEELARNVTGWPVHLVECFEQLDWTQHLEHLRPVAALLDVRSPERCERLSAAFTDAPRTVDVRLPRLGSTRGAVVAAGVAGVADPSDDPKLLDAMPADPVEPPWHPRTAAFFAWRLQAPPLVWTQPRPSPTCAFGWSFSVLGNRAPLFSPWRREGDASGLATELHLPQPIRRTLFAADLAEYAAAEPPRPPFTALCGQFDDPAGTAHELAPDAAIAVFRNGAFIEPGINPSALPVNFKPRVVCRRLDPWPVAQPAGAILAIDVVAGRLALGSGLTTAGDPTASLAVAYHAGQAGWLGGGGYDRTGWLVPAGATIGAASVPVTRFTVATRPRPAGTPVPTHTSMSAALTAWAAAGRPPCVITIEDSSTYPLPAVALDDDSWLVIEAADGERPHLQTAGTGWTVSVIGPLTARDRSAVLTLSGLLVEGWIDLVGEVARLRLWHTTLVPGRALSEDGAPVTGKASIVAPAISGHLQLQIEAAFSILGPIEAPRGAEACRLLDCIVDGIADGTPAALGGPAVTGPPLEVERSTVLGAIDVARLDASESIITGTATVQRTQDGCVRFSYVAYGSVTPRRYRCQPEATADAAAEAAASEALAADRTLTKAQLDAIRAAIRAEVVAALVPAFTARRYGEPAYGQLHRSAPAEIARGAEDGSEMGALCHVKQSQREDNLRLRLAEYLPFGLDPALVYVT
jgi:hypothetical protein